MLYQAVGERDLRTTRLTHAQQTQNICITFRHLYNVGPASKTDVEDIGPTLYKCYTHVLSLPGAPSSVTQLVGAVGALKKVFRIFFRKPPNLVPWSATWLSIYFMDDKTDMAQGNRRGKVQNCRHYAFKK